MPQTAELKMLQGHEDHDIKWRKTEEMEEEASELRRVALELSSDYISVPPGVPR